MQLKDPTAWMDDLTVFIEDEEITETAALLELDLLYRGSRVAAGLWLSLVGIAAGALATVTLSPAIRESIWLFAAYLVLALALFRGLRPATERLVGQPIVWVARTTFFWAVLLACVPALTAGFDASWLAFGLSVAGGFFVGMMQGSLNPNCVKREDAWMGAALALGPLSAVVGTMMARSHLAEPGSIGAAVMVGATTAGLFSAPLSMLLFRLWDEAHGCMRMAMLFLHNENFASKAVTYLDHAIALRPTDPELYNLRGVAWSKMDESERAAADWRKVTELAPLDASPHMNLGVDHLRRSNFEAAIAAFGAALERDPKDATVHSNLGTAFEKSGDLDRAISHYDKAIALRSDYANAYSNRGYARFRQGDHKRALSDCDKALELNARLPAALVNRGHALAALRQYEAAAESYRNAIEMDTSPEVRQEALEGVEAIEKARSKAAELSPT